MLTEKQIDKIRSAPTKETVLSRWVERHPTSTGYGMTFESTEIKAHVDWHDLIGVCNQAEQAIDLAAENAQLKAELAEYAETFHEQNNALSDHIIKLDAVRSECYKHIPANKIERRCLLDEYDIGQADLADNVLAIIDKDGDDK